MTTASQKRSSARRLVVHAASPSGQQPITLSPRHPICRGDFPILVFSGSNAALSEITGEATAHALYKYALPDPRLSCEEDFARARGLALPIWESKDVKPVDGVCFVFEDDRHPALTTLRQQGAIENEHYVTLDHARAPVDESTEHLRRFAQALSAGARVLLLGYGQQGACIASQLRNDCGFESKQITVVDGNPDSRARANADGFHALLTTPALDSLDAIIYSPLMQYEELHRVLEQARAHGLPTFDNRRPPSGLTQFVRRGRIHMDAAAERLLAVNDDILRPHPHRHALRCMVVREDEREINGVRFPHLHGAQWHVLQSMDDYIHVAAPSPFDQHDCKTRMDFRRGFVSVRDRADLGFFAARELCAELWPRATQEIFPSRHVLDLGATPFEILLRGQLDAREIVTTMQTPAQRVALGVAARHYAHARPIIEIGSALGGSGLLMAAATTADRPIIHSIDPETSTREIMRWAFARQGHADRLRQIVEPSERAIAHFAALQGTVGLVFIDGLHTSAAVAADYENYAPLIAPRGALVFHDVCPQIHSVFQVVMGHVLLDPRFEIKCLVDGLAIFERKEP